MSPQRPQSRSAGFTLIEALVVLALLGILTTLAVPAFLTSLRSSTLLGVVKPTEMLLRRAHAEAIKTAAQGVVAIEPPTPTTVARVVAFGDRNANGVADPGEPVLGTVSLPGKVRFVDPAGRADALSVEGFSPNPVAGGANLALFRSDGSIAAVGGFRFGDESGNYLEVHVEPAATARIQLRKWQTVGATTDWYVQGEGSRGWSWN